MAKKRQRRVEREDEDEEDEAEPRRMGVSGGRLIGLVVGAAVIGFFGGFFTGRDAATREAGAGGPSAPFAGDAGLPSVARNGGGPSGPLAPAVLPPPHKGHTFTGDISVPPHSEEAHHLADLLVAGITCPCGGCEKMTLDSCQCDTSKEIAGYAAHLLERGKRGDTVLAQLATRYGFAVEDSIRTRAAGMKLASPSLADGTEMEEPPSAAMPQPAVGGQSEAMEALSKMGDLNSKGVQRLTDVPTSARPGSEKK